MLRYHVSFPTSAKLQTTRQHPWTHLARVSVTKRIPLASLLGTHSGACPEAPGTFGKTERQSLLRRFQGSTVRRCEQCPGNACASKKHALVHEKRTAGSVVQ